MSVPGLCLPRFPLLFVGLRASLLLWGLNAEPNHRAVGFGNDAAVAFAATAFESGVAGEQAQANPDAGDDQCDEHEEQPFVLHTSVLGRALPGVKANVNPFSACHANGLGVLRRGESVT
jgi:hypothetical protein